MKKSRFNLGIGLVQQVPFTIQRQPQAVQTKQKEDSIISWKFLKIFAVIAVIKVFVFLLLM